MSSSLMVRVLEAEPDFARPIPKAEAAAARERSITPALPIPEGAWTPPLDADLRFLLLDGLLIRQMAVGGRETVELLGPGDVLATSECEPGLGTVQTLTDWVAVEPSTLAVLDGDWGKRMAPWPDVQAALTCRALERSTSMMVRLSLAEIRNLPARLHLLLWHLADRFGRVYPDRVELPLGKLTHDILADLMCARRESVCRALRTLRIYDLVRTRPDAGFILLGPSPDQVEALTLHVGTMRARRRRLGTAVRKALVGITRV